MLIWRAVIIGMLSTVAAENAVLAATERYVAVNGSGQIGTLEVVSDKRNVSIDYRIDNNGRGPKIKETLVLGREGLPVRWEIQGTRDKGAPFRETYQFEGANARWESLVDKGSMPVDRPPLYFTADSSPWSYGMVLRALLARPSHSMDSLPMGTMRTEKLRDIELSVGSGHRTQKVAVYALWGIGLAPEFVLATPKGEFFGTIEAHTVLVPQGFEGAYQQLSQLATDLHRQYLTQFTEQLLHRFDRPVYIRNVRVFDGENGTLGNPSTVIVHDNRIVGVRQNEDLPSDAIIIEGEGGTLLAGLTDMHAHVSFNGGWDLILHLAGGVTSVRDAGGDNAVLPKLVSAVREGTLMGPRLTLSGFLEGASPFSARYGFVVDSIPNALEKVKWYADNGYWGIKIYNSMNPEWVPDIAAEAHRLGLHVSGHVPAFMSSERAVRSGYDEINHMNQLVLSFLLDAEEDTRTPLRFTAIGERLGALDLRSEAVQRMVALMQERGTAVDVTMAGLENMLRTRPGFSPASMEAWLTHMPGPIQRDRRAPILEITPDNADRYTSAWEKLLEVLKMLHDAGIKVLPGTDDIPGFVLHSDIEAFGRAGISNARVLQIATLEGARFLGLEHDLGTIERGKLADFILIDGDPTQNLGDIRKIRMVMKNGDAIFPEEVYQKMGIKPFARKAEVRNIPQ